MCVFVEEQVANDLDLCFGVTLVQPIPASIMCVFVEEQVSKGLDCYFGATQLHPVFAYVMCVSLCCAGDRNGEERMAKSWTACGSGKKKRRRKRLTGAEV